MNNIDLDKILSSSFKSLKSKPSKTLKVSKPTKEINDNDNDDPFIIPTNYTAKKETNHIDKPQDIKSQIMKNDKAREAYLQHMQELERKKQIEEYERKTGKKVIKESPKQEYIPKTFSALTPCPGFEEQRKKSLQQKINPIKFNTNNNESNDDWDVPQQDRYKNYTKPAYRPDVGTQNYDSYQEKKYSAVYEYWKDPKYVPPSVRVQQKIRAGPGK